MMTQKTTRKVYSHATRERTHTHTHAGTCAHARAHTHTHARTRARTHARTQTHTHNRFPSASHVHYSFSMLPAPCPRAFPIRSSQAARSSSQASVARTPWDHDRRKNGNERSEKRVLAPLSKRHVCSHNESNICARAYART